MYRAEHIKYTLQFHQPAGTSRGTLRTKDSWIVRISGKDDPVRFGLGEISLIPGLSPDNPDAVSNILERFAEALRNESIAPREWLMGVSSDLNGISRSNGPGAPASKIGSAGRSPGDVADNLFTGSRPVTLPLLRDFPAVQFGIETAFRDLENGGNRILYPSAFTDGTYGIPINGLIWMGDPHNMLEQISRKLDAGFRIIKLKVGALDFQDELEVLEAVRSEFSASYLEIRLDANGAWSPDEALEKLNRLSVFGIHSLEQPIAAGNQAEMARVCEESPIPIALDEELIGVWKYAAMRKLLEVVRPAYIILKPSLLGGLERSKSWIDLAGKLKIGWWITSALESNVGLNAIAQWTATLDTNMPQGLGTGSLYKNNIPSPLEVLGNRIYYRSGSNWDLSALQLNRNV